MVYLMNLVRRKKVLQLIAASKVRFEKRPAFAGLSFSVLLFTSA